MSKEYLELILYSLDISLLVIKNVLKIKLLIYCILSIILNLTLIFLIYLIANNMY